MKLFTTCLNYADFLEVTLPAWKTYGDVHVITSPQDPVTQEVCWSHGLRPHVTEEFYVDGSPCNKGAAQNHIVRQVADQGDLVVMFDADCYPVGRLPKGPLFTASGVIHGCMRFDCKTNEEFERNKQRSPSEMKPAPIGSYRPNLVRGYFQMFIYHKGLRFGRKSDRTFSGCDLYLAAQFPIGQYLPTSEFYVLHLGERQKNWKGRVTEQWQS